MGGGSRSSAPSRATRRRPTWLAAVLLAPALAACLAPPLDSAGAVDPIPQVLVSDYDLGEATVPGPFGVAYAADLRGTLYLTEGAEGPRPVILVEHGNHGTCRNTTSFFFPPVRGCDEAGGDPIRSDRGYAYLAEPLARAGYVVLSLDANAVNDRSGYELDPHWLAANLEPSRAQEFERIGPASDALRSPWREAREATTPTRDLSDQGIPARADLLLATLDALRDRPPADLAGRLDLTRVGLVGHSRGAEAVLAALDLNAARERGERHSLAAVVSIAPTTYDEWDAAGAALLFVLGYCDGDEWDLGGAVHYDHALRRDEPRAVAQALAYGANHGGYNSAWFDEAFWLADDPHCGVGQPTRMDDEEQRAHGAELIVPFLRRHVGGELVADDLVLACVASCPFALGLSTHPAPDDRLVLLSGREADPYRVARAEGFENATTCVPIRCPGWVAGAAPRLLLSWTGDAALEIPVPSTPRFTHVSLRVATPDDAPGNVEGEAQDLRVVLVDTSGRRADALVSGHAPHALAYPPGSPAVRRAVLNEVRIPFEAFAGVDAARLASIRVEPATTAGTVMLADLMLLRA